MGEERIDIKQYCRSLTQYSRRNSHNVSIGGVVIGHGNPIAVQTMTDTDTKDTDRCVEQIGRIYEVGGRVVRLTAQGVREAENLKNISARVKELYPDVALVADIHFLPQAAYVAADYVDKVRINPGNYNDKGGDFKALLDKCKERGVALRIGVNHGSLAQEVVDEWGDTPQGMVRSAMDFLKRCREESFSQVVVSMKSSNTRVMVHAYRLLMAEMELEGMSYPIHLGVTEAGNGAEGVVKSAVGIGALLADGIGDTIRVSLTEPPENEIPVGVELVRYFESRTESCDLERRCEAAWNPYDYSRRKTEAVGRVGGGGEILLCSELSDEELQAIERGDIAVVSACGDNPVGEWREVIIAMEVRGDRRPVVLHRKYSEKDINTLRIKAAADFGVLFIDGLADGIWIENDSVGDVVLDELGNCGPVSYQSLITQADLDSLSLDILQGSRARISKTEYIACPGCGRTLFKLHDTLAKVKSRTSHLKGLKIGVMGCIVNGPGEMADADYGYVGAAPGNVSIYRGRELVVKNIPQETALDALVELIKADGKWIEID